MESASEIFDSDSPELAGSFARNNEVQQQHRWQFTAIRSASADTDEIYNEVEFMWTANPQNKQGELVRPLRIAAVIVHHDVPFRIKVAITGRLVSGWRQFSYQLSSRSRVPNGKVIKPIKATVIIWDKIESLQKCVADANEAHIPGKSFETQLI